MKKNHSIAIQFGRKRVPQRKDDPTRSADLALVCGVITLGVFFFGTLTGGSLTKDAERAESAFDGEAVPVMNVVTDIREETEHWDAENIKEYIRKSLRDSASPSGGDPFGYMNGKWNLWEYLGDVMADLLIGG